MNHNSRLIGIRKGPSETEAWMELWVNRVRQSADWAGKKMIGPESCCQHLIWQWKRGSDVMSKLAAWWVMFLTQHLQTDALRFLVMHIGSLWVSCLWKEPNHKFANSSSDSDRNKQAKSVETASETWEGGRAILICVIFSVNNLNFF